MASQEVPVFMEATAREMAKELFRRFGAHVVSDELSEAQRRERLEEILAHVVHDGILTGYGILHLTTADERVAEIELTAEHRGYLNAMADIDKGQGA